MIVRVDVYTKDVNAALSAFKTAFETGASDLSLNSYDDRDARVVRYFNLSFEAEHSSEAISDLDNGPFNVDPEKL